MSAKTVLLACVVFFGAAAAAATSAGLLVTKSRTAGWRLVYRAPGAGSGPSARPVRSALLKRWREARGEPPEDIRALDGAAVELVGLARPEPGAGGLWLVSSPFALHEGAHPPADESVWIELPESLRRSPGRAGAPPGEAAGELLVCGRVVRARGLLRVGLERVGAATAAYRLELLELWAREGPAEGVGHGEHCCH